MNYDVTGWCDRSRHHRCDGSLHTGEGWHWFCACLCHPEPTAADCAPGLSRQAVDRALGTWRAARRRVEGATA